MRKIKEKIFLIGGGALVGLAGGFFGGGGGMLCVPLLNKLLKLETKRAHATAMLAILPMSIAAAVTYFFGGHFDLLSTLMTGAGVLAGGVVGALLLKKLNPFAVAVIFAVLMIAAGVKLIFF